MQLATNVPPLASILIRTKNEEKRLATILEAILRQSLGNHEIIVVDSGSTDGTLEIMRSFKDIDLITMEAKEFTFGRALNLGARRARGKYLVMLSAHAVPKDDQWLFRLVRHFKDPQVAGVYGRQLPYEDAYPPVKVDYLSRYGPEARVETSVEEAFFSNANAAMRRDLWEGLPFDEKLPACEDQDWARRVLAKGYKLVYDPEAAVYHSHNESPLHVYRRYRNEELGWREILPDRRVSFRSFCEIWRLKTTHDIKFVLKRGESLIWLPLSPIYRFFWAFGQWQPYLW